VAIFARIMLDNRIPVIFGSGRQTRDFIEVADVAEANLTVMKKGLIGSYNVGTGIATSVTDIASRIAMECHFSGAVRYEDARPGEIEHIVLNSALLTRVSGWEAKVGLDRGIKVTVDHFRGDID
jgi:UDP-glucose 4-epimerase